MKPDLSFAVRRRFAPLFCTQFLGAFNDNLFKTVLFVLIGFYGLGAGGGLPAAQLLNIGTFLFVLPYFLFSAPAGQLATRFNKARLAQLSKLMEIAVMALAGWGFYAGCAPLLLGCLFLMGTQSTLFGPVKYAVLPEYLNERELVMGNGLIESGTFVAILLGQIIGTSLAGNPPHWLAGTVLAVAVAGWLCSLRMPSVPPREADLRIDVHIGRSTAALLRETFAQRPLTTAIVGISWFWFAGAVYTTQLPMFVQQHLGGGNQVFNLMLMLFSVGIAVGSVWCAKLSRQTLRLELAAAGLAGLTLCGVLLAWTTLTRLPPNAPLLDLADFLGRAEAYPVMLLLAGIGVFGGFFSVPLYTWLQTASSDAFRARAVAANNIVNGLFMVASAVFGAAVLAVSDNIALLYLLAALGNVPVLAWLLWREAAMRPRK